MSDSLKNGLMVFIAALLVVNTVLLVKGGSSSTSYTDPTAAKANFERSNPESMAVANKKATAASIDPMKTASTKPTGPLSSIKFEDSTYDFGKVMQDSENKKVFTFTNTGKEPLVISNAKGSCGCTVPQWPKEPIAPGATGEIKVVYKPGKQKDKQHKTVTITANTEPEQTVISISADVQQVPA